MQGGDAERWSSWTQFLSLRRPDLRRIAARTGGDHSIEDVCTEAWLVAEEIARKRGIAVDWSNADDQDRVLSWLHSRLVKWAEKSVRFAVKLDRDWDKEDGESALDALARLLTAPEQFDPLVRLLDEEERFDPLSLIQHSYSQASAYVILLHRFAWDLEVLAAHLHLVADTVRARVWHSGIHMRRQPSLFDRISTIDVAFTPSVARQIVRREEISPTGFGQLSWDIFDSPK